jgi:regulator of nonsense transcripts 1
MAYQPSQADLGFSLRDFTQAGAASLAFNDFTQGVSQALDWDAPGIAAAAQRQGQVQQGAYDPTLSGLAADFQQQLRFQEAFDEADDDQASTAPEKAPEWACA